MAPPLGLPAHFALEGTAEHSIVSSCSCLPDPYIVRLERFPCLMILSTICLPCPRWQHHRQAQQQLEADSMERLGSPWLSFPLTG